jgi:hypothetical protein
MKTYIFNETKSPKRGYQIRITVYRVKHNQPHMIGSSDHQSGAWMGARAQACGIIHDVDGIPWDTKRNGCCDRYSLRGLLGFSQMYDDGGPHHRNAVRLFECSGALQ